jgi:hypothetical protein
VHRHKLVEAWQFPARSDPALAERVALDRLEDPDVHLIVLSAGAGWIRGQVVSGVPRVGALLYVGGRGLFEVVRRDEWASAGGNGSRLLVTIRVAPPEVSAAAAG